MPKTIAFLDDEPEMEFIYSMMLEHWTAQRMVDIKFFSDPRAFLEWFKDERADLLVSDINLPRFSGIEMARTMKKNGRTLPIFFVSGDDVSEHASSLQELSDYRYFCKPIQLTELLGPIELKLGLLPANA